MTPEKQCISLELAKRMSELEFTTNSVFEWISFDNSSFKEYQLRYTPVQDTSLFKEKYPAYNVAELGEILRKIDFEKIKMNYTKDWDILISGLKVWESKVKEADNRAEIIIYLAENNLINPKELCN